MAPGAFLEEEDRGAQLEADQYRDDGQQGDDRQNDGGRSQQGDRGQERTAVDLRELLKASVGPEAELTPEHYAPVGNRDILLRLSTRFALMSQPGVQPGAALKEVLGSMANSIVASTTGPNAEIVLRPAPGLELIERPQ